MHEDHDDFIKFLTDPEHYMDQELRLKEYYTDETYVKPFPVVMLGDIELWMNHYKTRQQPSGSGEKRGSSGIIFL